MKPWGASSRGSCEGPAGVDRARIRGNRPASAGRPAPLGEIMSRRVPRAFWVAVASFATGLPAWAQDWSAQVWDAARGGSEAQLLRTLEAAPQGDDAFTQHIRATIDRLKANIAEREAQRATRIEEVRAELAEHLAGEATNLKMSKALGSALELWLLSPDRAGVLADSQVVALIARADAAAKASEAAGDWMMASELFFRLDQLTEQAGTYRKDSIRTNARLSMLRMYAPERLWELRNARQVAEGEDPLPPYNPFGDEYTQKIAPIDEEMVIRSILRAGAEHVEKRDMKAVLQGGIEAVRTFITTSDLRATFPTLGDAAARAQMEQFLTREQEALAAAPREPDAAGVDGLVRRVLVAARVTLDLPSKAVLHEFGNGALGALDEYSSIIWPDEKARFERMTQGKFVGVGISIEYDELQNIKVVTPLEGTPAQRAGVRAGDIIKKVDGRAIFGITIDQAVDIITGPPDTRVVLTMERKLTGADGVEQQVQIDIPIVRSVIETPSVKGWTRSGTHEDDWNWFVDEPAQIGYARLSQFTDTTAGELDRAIRQMKQRGLKGLVLDLRFNPGGLMNQAVEVVSRMVDGAVVVKTKAPSDVGERVERGPSGRASLRGIPVVVLINETSASASEIVSGAVQAYARQGRLDAIVLGQRSFGKGSVQNVYLLSRGAAALKLTTQFYYLPDDRLVHRRPGATDWGVQPDLAIDMLPKQVTDSIILRRNADVIPLDEFGKPIEAKPDQPAPNPQDLLTKPLDLQLQTAVVILQAQALKPRQDQAMRPLPELKPIPGPNEPKPN